MNEPGRRRYSIEAPPKWDRGSAPTILGIDLGTTFSTAAAVVGGKLRFALDERGEACIPSVVYFGSSGPPLVGERADKMRISDPANAVWGVKRLLGRSKDSPAVRLLDATSNTKLRALPGDEVGVVARGRDYGAPEVAAMIIRYLRERAEVRFGTKLKHAVITVPVAASQKTRDATQLAARMAGLEVVRIVHEPCAAAVAAGLQDFRGQRKMLVYDFGGGTFDVTAIEQSNTDFRVLSSGGDDCLGGDNLDEALGMSVINHLWKVYRFDANRDIIAKARIERQAELVKRALSSAPETHFRLEKVCTVGGRPQDLDLKISRSEVEPLWQELVDRTLRITAECMLGAKLRPQDLAAVVLVGGTTFVPLVRTSVARVFGSPVSYEADPQTTVAAGAAILAGDLARLEAA